VLDLGTGNGIIPILMEAKTKGEKFFGLEIQEESADLARRSVALNGLEDKIEIVTGDMKEAADIFGAASFHVITMNPQYMTGNHGVVNPTDAKAIARHEITCSLEEMIAQASKVLKSKGRFYMVHRPFRLAEIMTLMVKYHLEPKRMRLVYPFGDKEPNMVLIEGLKGGNSRITVEPPLIVYEQPGVYTEELKRMYYEV
jgi:tRNA1(Val) A37 N6-methylase TrmN6